MFCAQGVSMELIHASATAIFTRMTPSGAQDMVVPHGAINADHTQFIVEDRKNGPPCLNSLPCLTLPCLALPCLALPCLAFPLVHSTHAPLDQSRQMHRQQRNAGYPKATCTAHPTVCARAGRDGGTGRASDGRQRHHERRQGQGRRRPPGRGKFRGEGGLRAGRGRDWNGGRK